MFHAGRLLVLLPGLAALGLGCGSSGPAPPPTLLFVSSRDGDYAIFGVSADGHERRLTKEKGDPSTPAGLFFQTEPDWSPNGRLLAFVSRRDGRSRIYVMRLDGARLRRLTNSPADDSNPTWSPDGRRIAFAREGALFVIPAQGGRARRLTRGVGGDSSDPAWSPSGRLIAFDRRLPGFSIREIWVVRRDGSGIRPVTRLRAASTVPAWSPDGRRIAFQSNVRGGHVEIYSIALDGHGLRRETRSSIDTIDPAWSPNGREIAFSRDGAIWTVDRGGRSRKLTSGEGNDAAPVWRPAPH